MTDAMSAASKPPREPNRRLLSDCELIVHARARVEQQRHRERKRRLLKECELLRAAVFEDTEIVPLEIGHKVLYAVQSP